MYEKNTAKRGAFWIIDGKLFAFPFEEGKYIEGIAKSKNTYAHKRLWKTVSSKGCNKPYNYYPRGRVHITEDGTVHLYLSPHIGSESLPEIKEAFGVIGDVIIHYQYTSHYFCYLDEGWNPNN